MFDGFDFNLPQLRNRLCTLEYTKPGGPLTPVSVRQENIDGYSYPCELGVELKDGRTVWVKTQMVIPGTILVEWRVNEAVTAVGAHHEVDGLAHKRFIKFNDEVAVVSGDVMMVHYTIGNGYVQKD